jgi:hypothetical protein
MNANGDRRWSATITFDHQRPCGSETITAEPAEWDLQKEQAKAAIREAAAYLALGLAEEAEVTLWKTTQAHGRTRDQRWLVYFDERRGEYRAQR